jgi:hypothetical protein
LHFCGAVHDEAVQHAPSTQVSPAAQSPTALHDAPAVPAETHALPEHLKPVAQSGFVEQVVLHAVAPHAYAPHGEVDGVLHDPVPLQYAAFVWMPEAHEGEPHIVDVPA